MPPTITRRAILVPVVDNELWRWVWVALAVSLSIAEIFTAGFFLLPFGIGAAVAAVLAWVGATLVVQWLAFIVVSILALIALQRFVRHQDLEDVLDVGANRYLRKRAVVLERVDPVAGTGRVRVATEEWRATSDGEIYEPGARVVVAGIDGARLVVTDEGEEP